ncbi:Dynein light chain Tctex-type 1 [Halotydeus destructor]|nr:Dynein light chain Tctex-type 1 [Halotydeus destructor]
MGDQIEGTFNSDEVQQSVKMVVEKLLGGNTFQQSKVNQWSNSIVEETLSYLTKQAKAFKYIVTSVIMQKNGAGLHTTASCYWDNTTDGSCIIRWENKNIHCIVQVFAVAI